MEPVDDPEPMTGTLSLTVSREGLRLMDYAGIVLLKSSLLLSVATGPAYCVSAVLAETTPAITEMSPADVMQDAPDASDTMTGELTVRLNS